MEIYNQALLAGGLTNSGFTMNVKEWIVLSIIVFTIENIYGGRIAICVMCPSMSLVASIMFKEALYHGISYFFATWIQTIAMNIPMALVWQLAVCGPLVRFINRKIVVPTELKLQAN